VKLKYKILGILTVTIIGYFLGSLIALDFNPLNWKLLTTIIGRIFLSVYIYAGILSLFTDED
jgi:hypothetical protein